MCLASRPKYLPRKVERSKLTDAVCAEIEYWLSENAKRRQTGMRKQCLKRQDIHRALIEKGSVALRQMPDKMQELFRVHFADNGKDFLRLLKYYRERGHDHRDILDAVRQIRMRSARHINFDQIKVALETRDAAPLTFTDS